MGIGPVPAVGKLMEKLGEDNLCLISQDNYYFDRDKQPVDEKGVKNFDLPDSIDFKDFVTDIEQLKSGKEVVRKEYTFNNVLASADDMSA